MSNTFLKEISLENLEKLEKIFSRDWFKHIVIILTLKTFIKQFELFPELKERFKLFALTDDWENDGGIFATYECNEIETFTFFDSLNDSIDGVLIKVLKALNYSKLIDYYAVRNIFKPIAMETTKELSLEIVDETDGICYYMPKEDAKLLEIKLPPRTCFKSLSQSDVEKINETWPHRYTGSDKFISYTIKYHISLGLFSETNELIAWCLRYDNGSLALLQVDKNHMRKGFGSLIAKAMSKKIAVEFDSDVTAIIVQNNQTSIKMFTKIGFAAAGVHSWLVVKNQ